MNNDIRNDMYLEKYNEFVNKFIDEYIKQNSNIIIKYPILEIEYDINGEKKDIYSLASERDIKKMQINSDKNELDFKFSQNNITKEEYEKSINDINDKMKKIDLLYDDLIFSIINTTDIEDIKKTILNYKLNNIDLDRLARAISSVSDNKIEEFRNNNKLFMLDKLSYWNYKYNKISKSISKARDLEIFIKSIIEKNVI